MDLQIVQTETGFDIALDGPDLAVEYGLRTAIIISLFTDRRAANDDVLPDGSNDRRGWWANPELGSRLWLLTREKQTTETLVRAREYCIEALQWLLDDGVLSSLEVTTSWSNEGIGVLLISVVADGEQVGAYDDMFNYSLKAA